MAHSIDEKERTAFWDAMTATGFGGRWSVKKERLMENIHRLPQLITNDHELTQLFQAVSLDKLAIILKNPALSGLFNEVFSSQERSARVLGALDGEKYNMVLRHSVFYLTSPEQFIDVMKHLDFQVDQQPFFEQLTSSCADKLCAGRYLFALMDAGCSAKVMQPLLERYARTLMSSPDTKHQGLGRQMMSGLGATGIYTENEWRAILVRCAKSEAIACVTPHGLLKASDRALYEKMARFSGDDGLAPKQIESAARVSKEVTHGTFKMSTQLLRELDQEPSGGPSHAVMKPK